jgi:hypothetical protein
MTLFGTPTRAWDPILDPFLGPLFEGPWAVPNPLLGLTCQDRPKRGPKMDPFLGHFGPFLDPFLDPFLSGPGRLILAEGWERPRGPQKGVPKMTPKMTPKWVPQAAYMAVLSIKWPICAMGPWGPPGQGDPFWGHFWGPFWDPFLRGFGSFPTPSSRLPAKDPQKGGPKKGPKMTQKWVPRPGPGPRAPIEKRAILCIKPAILAKRAPGPPDHQGVLWIHNEIHA